MSYVALLLSTDQGRCINTKCKPILLDIVATDLFNYQIFGASFADWVVSGLRAGASSAGGQKDKEKASECMYI